MHFVGLSDLCVGVCIYFGLYFHMSSTSLWLVSVASPSLCLMTFFPPLSHDLEVDPLQPVTSDETVSVGGTVTLTCRVTESDNSSLQWSNTAQQTLYFGEKRGKKEGERHGECSQENPRKCKRSCLIKICSNVAHLLCQKYIGLNSYLHMNTDSESKGIWKFPVLWSIELSCLNRLWLNAVKQSMWGAERAESVGALAYLWWWFSITFILK